MEKVKLGDCATFINGYAFKPSDWGSVGLPIIRIQNLTGSMKNEVNYYDGKYPKKVEINNGDVLISWSASLGVYEWNGGKALLNQHIFKVVFDKLEFNKSYFIHLIKSKLSDMLNDTHGSTMKHITKSKFDNIPVDYITLPEQKRIADELDKACSAIEKQKKQLALFDELIKSKFNEMFGVFDCNEILRNVCKFINGDRSKNYPKGEDYVISGIPFINAGDIKDGYLTNEKFNYITQESFDKLSSGKVQVGDILYCLRGSLGKHCIVNIDKGAVASSLVILRPNNKKILSEYLDELLYSQIIENQMLVANNGSSQPNLSAESVKNYKFYLPPFHFNNGLQILWMRLKKVN